MAKKNYEYISKYEIDNITTKSGEVIDSKDLLDGAYKRLSKISKKIEEGKKNKRWDLATKEMMKKVDKLWDELDIQSGSQLYSDQQLQKKYIDKLSSIDNLFLSSTNKQKTLDFLTDENYHNVRAYLEMKYIPKGRKEYERIYKEYKNTLNPDNVKAEFAKGGSINFMLRIPTLREQAEQMVGYDNWNTLDAEQQSELIREFIASGDLQVPYYMQGGSIYEEHSKGSGGISTYKYYKVPNEQLWAIQECNSAFDDGFGGVCIVIGHKKSEQQAIEFVEHLNKLQSQVDSKYAEGGGVAEAKYKVTFEINGTKKEKSFDSKEKADSFVELMSDDDDIKNIKIEIAKKIEKDKENEKLRKRKENEEKALLKKLKECRCKCRCGSKFIPR
jgi:hypothetical protein